MTTSDDVARVRSAALESWCRRLADIASEIQRARSAEERARLEALLLAVAMEATR